MIKLIGVVIIVAGFALKMDAIGTVITAGIVTGLVGGLDIINILTILGKSFIANRYMAVFMIILPIIGLLERNGLRESAKKFISTIKSASPGKVTILYGLARTITAAFNISVGGVVGFVRPIILPMAVGSLENKYKKVNDEDIETIKGMTAAQENIAWFFGQILFVAGAGVLLVKGTLDSLGYSISPLEAVKAEIPVVILSVIVSVVYFMIKDYLIVKQYRQNETRRVRFDKEDGHNG